MNHRLFFYSAIALALTACSGTNSYKHASGDYSYVNDKSVPTLKVPASLTQPKTDNKYAITNQINHQGPVGEKVDIRAPSLVLPVTSGARVELKDTGTTVWFDQVDESQPLEPLIVHAIAEVLKDQHSSIKEKDDTHLRYQSDWIEKTQEQGFWLWKYNQMLNKAKFEYQLSVKPHGRSVSVSVKMVAYQGLNSKDKIDPIDKQRAQVDMLNAVIGQVGYQYRLLKKEKREHRATQKLVSMAKNAKNQPAYLVDMDLDSLWSNMPIFFEHNGFKITDLNESNKIYYVDYVKPSVGFWASLWGNEKPIIDLPNGKYVFDLAEQGDNTLVTISTADGKVLTQQTLTAIFPAIEPTLSFRTEK